MITPTTDNDPELAEVFKKPSTLRDRIAAVAARIDPVDPITMMLLLFPDLDARTKKEFARQGFNLDQIIASRKIMEGSEELAELQREWVEAWCPKCATWHWQVDADAPPYHEEEQ